MSDSFEKKIVINSQRLKWWFY